MNAPLTRIDTIHEDAELRLRYLRGVGRRLVVVFTGRHHEFGDQPADEFAASANAGGQNSLLFVSDLQQSWYSRPGLWARIVRWIVDVAKDHGASDVVSLGNSMGGFGALLLPRDMSVSRAIGFSAQVSMDQNVIREDRWPTARRRFGKLPVRSIADTVAKTDTTYFLTAGSHAPKDVAQMALMPRGPRVFSWALAGAGHNIARRLKHAGALMPAIDAMITGDADRVEAIYRNYQQRQGAAAPCAKETTS